MARLKELREDFSNQKFNKMHIVSKKKIDADERILVGVNKFADEQEAKQNLLRIDDSLRSKTS